MIFPTQHSLLPSPAAQYRYICEGRANESASVRRFRERLRHFTFEITSLGGDSLENSAFVIVGVLENGESFQSLPLRRLERISTKKRGKSRYSKTESTLFGVAA